MSSGLFRAIKSKPKVDTRQPALIEGLPNALPASKARRVEKDYYPTGEPEAILSLLHADGDRIKEGSSVWEPACGKGDMVRQIRDFGIPCCASDLEDRGCPDSWTADYYSCRRSRCKSIITNPPYCEINSRGHGRWLRHTLEMPDWDYLALLLSWDWPAAKMNGMGRLLDENPFSYCYLMRWRLDFTGEGSPPSCHAWFVWDKKSDLNKKMIFMDRHDPRQGDLLDG